MRPWDGKLLKTIVDNSEEVADFLSALSNSKRLAIMCHLIDEELSVGDIAKRVNLSQSALSQHLAKLRHHDLVRTRRERQMIFYSCNSQRARSFLCSLEELFSTGKTAAAFE